MGDQANHNHCTHQFVDLANKLKDDGFDTELISAALMSASGIYATFIAAGNDGALNPSGVEKVVDLYKRNLEFIQSRKKEEAKKMREIPPGFGAS